MENTDIKTNFKSYIVKAFEDNKNKHDGNNNQEIFDIKNNFFEKFLEKGLPTLKWEHWKYTNLAFLNKIDFDFKNKIIDKTLLEKSEFYYNLADSYKIYLINGELANNISEFNDKNISFYYYDDISKNGIGEFSDYYGKLLIETEHTFAQINSVLVENVVVIKINNNANLEKNVQINNIIDSRNSSKFINTRFLIISGKSSSCKIIENTYTFGENNSVINTVKEIFMENNSHLNYYKIQDDKQNLHNFDFTQVKQERDSHFDEAAISINGKFIRNDLRSELNGENIETHFYGAFIAGDNDYVDNHTYVDHSKPNCFSNENYRGIISGKATGVFNGKIMVRPQAQKTNAYQSNKNILLSPNAIINTKPELEIYADDVKCSHGATSGALDKTSLFYLQARGIDLPKAERMLLKAFILEIVNEIKIEKLQELIIERTDLKLSQI